MKRSRKIITPAILLVSFISLFTDVASEMLYPIMPVFLKSIGFSVALIGFLEGIAEATAGLSKGYFGSLSDKMGRRVPFIKWGYGLSAISKPMMVAFFYPLWIFFARTLDRMGKGVRTSARDALLSDETTLEHKGKVFGFHRALDTTGAAIGPVIALIFLYYYPEQYIWLFLIAFLPGILSVLLTFFIKEKSRPVERKNEKISFVSYFKYWGRSTKPYKMVVIGLLMFTFFNSSDFFLLLVLKEKGYSDSGMIGFYIFYNLVYALVAYPIGVMADKLGLKKTLIAGLILFSCVYLSMSFVENFWLLGGVFLLYGFYAASTEGISKALVTNVIDDNETATAIGFYNSFASVMALLASTVGGLLWFKFSPQVMFWFSGVGAAFAAIYFIFIKAKVKKSAPNVY